MKHFPVMLPDVLEALRPKDGELYIDGTFGNGGYSEAFLRAASCKVVGLDRDVNVKPRAAELTAEFEGRFSLKETCFSKMDELFPLQSVDAVVLDIGVSSMQLDQAERGFSFMRAGPLDMRMGEDGPTASDVINEMPVDDLVRLFRVYGEEKRARRAAAFIDEARKNAPIVTTDVLAEILDKALGRSGKTHPATRVFQALRIFVNDELGELYKGLCAAERILKPGGRLIVVSFHSLEDRIVKQFFRLRAVPAESGSRYQPQVKSDQPDLSFKLPARSAKKPSKSELEENVRSRSAKLRVASRTSAPVYPVTEVFSAGFPAVDEFRWAS